jgi:hypothetical protein
MLAKLPRDHTDQSYDGFYFSGYRGPNGNDEDVLHGHAEFVLRFGDRLTTPMWVRRVSWIIIKAQIVDPQHDGVSERALEILFEWVLGRGYFEAAPAGVTKARIGTECEFIDRRPESVIEQYAARCTRTLRSAYARWIQNHEKKGAELTGCSTVMG